MGQHSGFTLVGKLSLGTPSELTISGGSITVTDSYHVVDTESDDPADDLTDIVGGEDGMLLVLQTADSGRDVTLKHNAGGAGTKIFCDGTGDFTLTRVQKKAMLIYDGINSYWVAKLWNA